MGGLAYVVGITCPFWKLLLTYSHREEDQGIAKASLFLRLMWLKVLPNQSKIFVNLTFSQKVWPFCLFWFNLSWECCESSRKEVIFWFCCGKYVNYLKSIIFDHKNQWIYCDQWTNGSFGKVLRSFGNIGKKFTSDWNRSGNLKSNFLLRFHDL